MKSQSYFATYVYLANRGRDDEFEIPCKVHFAVTPREARTLEYPGCEPEIEIIGVIAKGDLSASQMIQVEDAVIDELRADPSPLWDHVSSYHRDTVE